MPTKAVRLTMPLVGEANPAGYLVMVPGASVLIRQNGVALVGSAGPGTPAVFSDNDKTPMTNPVPTGVTPGTAGVDTEGRLVVCLNPGKGYDIQATVGNATTTVPLPDVGVDVEDVAAAADFTALEELVEGKQDAIPPGTYVQGVIVAGAGIDDTGATDSTAAINAKVAAASVVGAAADRMVRVRFPDGTYLTDGILAKPYTWLDLGNAVFKKRVDGTTPLNNSMLRAVPVGINSTATVTNKALTSNVATLTTSAAHGRVLGSMITVTDVDATFNGTFRITAVPSTTTFSYAKTAANVASVASGGTVTATTYYGTYKKMKVTGGSFFPNGKTCPANIVNLIYCEDLEVSGVTVNHDAACLNWAFELGGRRLTLAGNQVRNGTATFQDGLHIYHGQDITVNGGHYASGDDAIAIGGQPTDPYLSVDPDPIRHVTVSGVTVNSAKAHGLRVYSEVDANGPLWEVTDVTVKGIVGRAGVSRGGGIGILSHLDPANGNHQVRGVEVTGVKLDVGGAAHDDSNPYGAYVQSAKDVQLAGTMTLTEGAGATLGFDLAIVRTSEDVKLALSCEELGRRYGVDARDSARVTVANSRLRHGTLSVLAPIHFQDVVDAKALFNDIANVKSNIGGIEITAGTTTRATIVGNTVKHKALGLVAGDGLKLVAAAVAHLTVTGNDFTGTFRAADPAVIRTIASYIVAGNKGLSDIPLNSPWRTIFSGRSRFDANAAATTTLGENGAGLPGGSVGAMAAFYLDPADYPGGVTTKLRLSNLVLTNATAPVASFTVGLYPVSSTAGAAAAVTMTLGTVVPGSTVAVTTPALNTMTKVDSAEFDCPAAGVYVICVVISANMAASSAAVVRGTLQARAT